MRRAVTRGVLTGILICVVVYVLTSGWHDCQFIFQNFPGIVTGEVQVPAVGKDIIACLVALPVLIALLIGAIPKKKQDADAEADEERD